MLKCFPAKSLKLIPHQIDSMGTGVIMQKDDSVRQHSRAFWLYEAPQHPQPPKNEPYLSVFLCLPPFSMLETLYTTLTSRSIKKTTVWTCAFTLCTSPTLQMAVSIQNNSVASSCEECVLWRVFCFHLTAPYALHGVPSIQHVFTPLSRSSQASFSWCSEVIYGYCLPNIVHPSTYINIFFIFISFIIADGISITLLVSHF